MTTSDEYVAMWMAQAPPMQRLIEGFIFPALIVAAVFRLIYLFVRYRKLS